MNQFLKYQKSIPRILQEIAKIKNLKLVFAYLQWYTGAKNLHGVHSPFLYGFIAKCMNINYNNDLFEVIEKERILLKENKEIISYVDPGAGKRTDSPNLKRDKKITSISNIAKTSLQKQKFCRLFYGMVQYLNLTNILELGTSLGITTSYLSLANPNAKIDTVEGVEVIGHKALQLFEKLDCKNITLHTGTFNKVLPSLLSNNESYDMVIIDGDHKGEALLKYFDNIVKHISPYGVVVIDDIRWSDSMFKAWNEIKKRKDVRLTADLFYMGVLFINPDLSKENFQIKF